MKRLCIPIALAVLLATGGAAEPIADPAVALEKAVQIEQTTGNAAEAERLYREIIGDQKRRESAAAEARYRLGAMLLKQGKAEEAMPVLLGLWDNRQASAEWRDKAMALAAENNIQLAVSSSGAMGGMFGSDPAMGAPGMMMGEGFGMSAFGGAFSGPSQEQLDEAEELVGRLKLNLEGIAMGIAEKERLLVDRQPLNSAGAGAAVPSPSQAQIDEAEELVGRLKLNLEGIAMGVAEKERLLTDRRPLSQGENPFGFGMPGFGGEMMGGPMQSSMPMRSLEQIREAEWLLTRLEVESNRRELDLKMADPGASHPDYQMDLRREESLRNLVGLVRANPEAPNQWIKLGELLLGQENLAGAESAYKQALELKPPSQVEARVQSMLGQIAMKQDRDDQARMHFTHAMRADDRLMASFMGLAALAEKEGDTNGVIRQLHHVLDWEPDNREARAMLQRIDPDVEGGPAQRTEAELAASREIAINEGRFEDALTLEEKRLQLRVDANDIGVDRFSFSGLAKEWAEKHKPSSDRIDEAIMAVESRRKLLSRGDPRDWRFWLVMAELAVEKGDHAGATTGFLNAMNRYPERTYVDPAKYSFYQHLVDGAAVHWWSRSGRDNAIQNVISLLESERRLQTLNVDWWLDRIAQDGGDVDYQRRFLERVIQAYDKRAEQFPDQTGIIAAEKQILQRRIEQLRQ